MAQTFQELQGTTTLTDSRTILNNNMNALKTSFSGTSAPFSASATTEGATYYNTTDKKTYQVIKSGNTYTWALPSENVHTSGNESIAGAKTFTSDITAPNITTMASTLNTLNSTAAHLNGTETFTGNKTFSGTVSLGSSATATTKTVATNTTAIATTAYVKLAVPVSIGSSTKPVYTNASGVVTASNATVGSSSQPVYMNSGTITAITGAIANNTTGTAAGLTTARTINGTSFNGTANITTSKWGTARNITIKDYSEANSLTTSSIDGSSNITLKLPQTIKVTTQAVSDNSTNTATTAYVKLCVPKSIGSSSKPVYTNANGVVTACDLGVPNYVASSTTNLGDIATGTSYVPPQNGTLHLLCSGKYASARIVYVYPNGVENELVRAESTDSGSGAETVWAIVRAGETYKLYGQQSLWAYFVPFA